MGFYIKNLASPIGQLHLVASNENLVGIFFNEHWKKEQHRFAPIEDGDSAVLIEATRQLQAYFAGSLRDFDLPLQLEGTDFQKRVWLALRTIPYGETRTYKEQAIAIDAPNAVRAVGRTNGLNRFPIVLACHRVVGSDGKLTGYAGGLEIKDFLLKHESGQT